MSSMWGQLSFPVPNITHPNHPGGGGGGEGVEGLQLWPPLLL